MKVKFKTNTVIFMGIIFILGFFSCLGQSHQKAQVDPKETISFLARSIQEKNWNNAKNCFSRRIVEKFGNIMDSGDYFYAKENPLMREFGTWHILESGNYKVGVVSKSNAEVIIFVQYPSNPTEDGNVCEKKIRLIQENGMWKIDDHLNEG